MKDQHTLIKGYRDLSVDEIALMNEIKEHERLTFALLDRVKEHLGDQLRCANEIELARINATEPGRWQAMARTDFQVAYMKLVRAVAQPGVTT